MDVQFRKSMKSRSLIYHPVVAVVCLGVCWMLSSASLSARTLYFTEQDMVGTAVISSDAPELSWAAVPHGAGVYSVGKINLTRNSKLLIRFPVESIPDGYRIVRAELS